MKKMIKIMGVAVMVVILATGCEKQRNSGSMMVKLTDAPGDYQEVNVEVIGLEVHYEKDINDEEKWVSLKVNEGVYDLLELQDNVTAVLADENELPIGEISQMRLILGKNNTVVVDNITYGLEMSSQDETGLKINVNGKVKAWKTMVLLIDFDAEKSIVQQGVGSYKLKPVIEVKSLIYI